MDININNRCKVTLTKKGAEWLNKYNKQQLEGIRHLFNVEVCGSIEDVYPSNYKEGDEITLPLWELMMKFGNYFVETTEAPFIANNIAMRIG